MKLLSLPNLLSLSRIPLAFLVIASFESNWKYFFCGLAIFSDFLDGYFAKKFNQTSKLGAILDPATDKIFVVTIIIAFFIKLPFPIYYLALIFSRDIFSSFGFVIIKLFRIMKGAEIKARPVGKIVTVLQFLLLILLLSGRTKMAEITIYAIFLFSLLSIIDYLVYFYSKSKIKKESA